MRQINRPETTNFGHISIKARNILQAKSVGKSFLSDDDELLQEYVKMTFKKYVTQFAIKYK